MIRYGKDCAGLINLHTNFISVLPLHAPQYGLHGLLHAVELSVVHRERYIEQEDCVCCHLGQTFRGEEVGEVTANSLCGGGDKAVFL